MSTIGDDRDNELMAVLRDGLNELDSVPSDVTEFAKAALGWKLIDAELAAITFDSDVEKPAAVRSTTTTRMLSFHAADWTIDVEYIPHAGRLIGQISPEVEARIELHFAGGVAQAFSDARGRFDFDDVLPGPVSLVVRLSGDIQVIKTEWTVL